MRKTQITGEEIKDKSVRPEDLLTMNEPTDGDVLAYEDNKFKWVSSGGGGANKFTDLVDTPSSYEGYACGSLIIADDEKGIKFRRSIVANLFTPNDIPKPGKENAGMIIYVEDEKAAKSMLKVCMRVAKDAYDWITIVEQTWKK